MSEETYSFLCPSCSAHLSVPITMAGVSGPCPYCASEITSPLPKDVPPEHLEVIRSEGLEAAPDPVAEVVEQPWESEVFDPSGTSDSAAESATATAAVTAERVELPQEAPVKRSKKQRKREKSSQRQDRSQQKKARREEPAPLPRKPRNATPPVSDAPVPGMSLFSKLCLGVSGVALVAVGAVFGLPKIMGDQDGPAPDVPPVTTTGKTPDTPTVQPAIGTSTPSIKPEPRIAEVQNPQPENRTENRGPGTSNTGEPVLPDIPVVDPGGAGDPGIDVSLPKELTEFNAPADSILAKPRKALENFLLAKNWQERMKYCIGGQALAKTLKSYYSQFPGGQQEWVDITYTHHETDPDGVTQFFLFTVLFEVDRQGEPVSLEFPVVVEQKNGECLVEWETFAEFKDHHLQSFVAKENMNKPKAFHVVMTRDHFFGSDRELRNKVDSNQYLCVRVQSPNPEEGSVAFLNVATSAGKGLKDFLTWERTNAGFPATPYVELTWKQTASKTPYLEVTKLLSDKWRTPRT